MIRKIFKILAIGILSLVFLGTLVMGGYIVFIGNIFLNTTINIFNFLYFLFSAIIMGLALYKNKKTFVFLLGFLPVLVFLLFVVGEYLWNFTMMGAIFILYMGLLGQLWLLKKKQCFSVFLLFIPLFLYLTPVYLCEKKNYEIMDVAFKWNWDEKKCEEESTIPIIKIPEERTIE